MFNCYDNTLFLLLDVHALVRSLRVRASWPAPWYDADCREVKKETRRLEKLYRSSMAARWQLLIAYTGSLASRINAKYFNRSSLDTGSQLSTSARTTLVCVKCTRWWHLLRVTRPVCRQMILLFTSLLFPSRQRFPHQRLVPLTKNQCSISWRSPAVLSNFRAVNATEIKGLLSSISAKHCQLNPVPTWLVKRVATVLAPVLSRMYLIDLEFFLNPAIEEALTWSWRYELIHPDIKPQCWQFCFQACWKRCCKPLYRSRRTEQTVSCQTVCLQATSQYWVCCIERREYIHLYSSQKDSSNNTNK